MLTLDQVTKNSHNGSIIKYLNYEAYPSELSFIFDVPVQQMYRLNLSTHPDVVAFLWTRFASILPPSCQAILFGKPVLINPDTATIFGLAEGTHPVLLRLKNDDRNKALQNGGKLILSDLDGVYADARDIGLEWVYFFSFIDGLDNYFSNAYHYSKI